jgi:glycosyltransferase involved in cell wall biosynthesis
VLARAGDARVRVHVPPRSLGNGGARNAGVQMARARWVLDDDDVWMKSKLDEQLRVARGSAHRFPLVACQLIARTETQEFMWPRRRPRAGEPVSEYLFCRSTPYTGEGLIVTSVLFVERELLLHVPFREDLRRYVDTDWLLRMDRYDGTGIEFVPSSEPLAVWNIERDRPRITNTKDWEFSLDYARRNRQLFTRRSYAAFVLHVVSHTAGTQRAWRGWFPILLESLRHGRPAALDLFSHAGNFLLSANTRRLAAERFQRNTATAARMGSAETGKA